MVVSHMVVSHMVGLSWEHCKCAPLALLVRKPRILDIRGITVSEDPQSLPLIFQQLEQL